ncbi:MAG: methyltransferase domain-containing protein [Actinobacteria bacterium]|nr:methyltransferase domain-containing protein [Actinomycetota bacterium]
MDKVPLGLSFGAVATTYDRVRPPYFGRLLDRAQQTLELAPSAHVLDLGAGTGRLTRELVRRFARVVAVEPDDKMRALIDAGTILAGSAEAIPLESASVDAAFVGEAFHWFDARRAIAELARVLVPRGCLALISTHWWETEPPLPTRAEALLREPYRRFQEERRPRWDSAFATSPFEPLRLERFEEAITVDADALLELYSTTSSLAALPDDERIDLLAAVRPKLTGPYRLPIKHELSWTRLA